MMKTTITIILTLFAAAAIADGFSVHADAWRGNDYTPVERIGATYGDFGVSYSDANEAEQASIEWRRYIEFTNIEIGVMPAVTYGTGEGLADWRTIDIADNLFAEAKPYVKIGEQIYMLIMNDSTNQNTVRIGFRLF